MMNRNALRWLLDQWSVADPRFGQGGGGETRNVFRDFADVAKQSGVREASQYWPGKLLHFNCQICILPLFLVFFFKFLMYICVSTLSIYL